MPAPEIVRCPGFGVCLEKMVQHMQQGQYMVLIAAHLRLSNIVDNHVPDLFAAGLFGQKILSECCCRDLRDVFMLGDSEDFVFGQSRSCMRGLLWQTSERLSFLSFPVWPRLARGFFK